MYDRFIDAEASRNVRAQTSAWWILRNDPTFKAIMQETEYAYFDQFQQMIADAAKRGIPSGEINRVERSMLTHFVEMLASYGYTITRTPVEGMKQIGVDMAAGRDQSVMQAWHFPEVRALVNVLPQGVTASYTVVENFKHALTVEELIDAPTIKECQNCGGNTSNEAMTCDNCLGGQCYHCGALPGCTPNCSKCAPIECTCKSLLNGHENGCPLASK